MEPLHVNEYQTLISYSVSFEDTDGVPQKMSAVDDLRRHLANNFFTQSPSTRKCLQIVIT